MLNPRKWTREFEWGDLGSLMLSNGYDYDLLNDDALQNIASFEDGQIKIRNMAYKVLLLPNIEALPLKTLLAIETYVHSGGMVIALDRLPDSSTGLNDYKQNDLAVLDKMEALFEKNAGARYPGTKNIGAGSTHYFKHVIDRKIWWDKFSSALDPFLNTIRDRIAPDFGIDFAQLDMRYNNGLCFLHRKMDDADIYFVSNIQDQPVDFPVVFRVTGKKVSEWNPFTGDITPIHLFDDNDTTTTIPLHLKPYGSTLFVFRDGVSRPHVTNTTLHSIKSAGETTVVALAAQNGYHHAKVKNDGALVTKEVMVDAIPAPMYISGEWNLLLESPHFTRTEKKLAQLSSWTDDEQLRYFSGTGVYEIRFNVPESYVAADHELILDLGRVGDIAEVELNGRECGIIWMSGEELNVTSAVKAGINKLVIKVTNTNINRVSTFTEPLPIPDELQERFGTATASRVPREFGFKQLPFSGLGGPVKISVLKKVAIVLN